MKIRLRTTETPDTTIDPRARDCAWDKSEKRWRIFSDDCGSPLGFATAEQIKTRFASKYYDTCGPWSGLWDSVVADAMTKADREAFDRTGKRPSQPASTQTTTYNPLRISSYHG